MADPKLVKMLRSDIDSWNRWKVDNPRVMANLTGADLSHCDLLVANLSGADLSGANLVMANLNGADLSGANLQGTNLVGARMIGVDLEHADLRGADLRTAEDLTQEQIAESLGDEKTQLPDGLKRPASWPANRGS